MLRALLVSGLIFGAATLHAFPTFDFSLTGLDSNGDPISGTAIFTLLDAHHFTITVSNTTSMQELKQLLTGIEFELSAGGVALVTSSGEFVQLDGTGSATMLPSGTTGWGLEADGAEWLLCAQCGSDGSDILGNGPYPTGLTGMYLDSSVVFEFSTDSSLPTDGSDPFSDVSLSFGSASGTTWLPSGGSNNSGSPLFLTTGSQNTVTSNQTSSNGGSQTPNGGDPVPTNDPTDSTSSSSAVPEPPGSVFCSAALLGLLVATRFIRTAKSWDRMAQTRH